MLVTQFVRGCSTKRYHTLGSPRLNTFAAPRVSPLSSRTSPYVPHHELHRKLPTKLPAASTFPGVNYSGSVYPFTPRTDHLTTSLTIPYRPRHRPSPAPPCRSTGKSGKAPRLPRATRFPLFGRGSHSRPCARATSKTSRICSSPGTLVGVGRPAKPMTLPRCPAIEACFPRTLQQTVQGKAARASATRPPRVPTQGGAPQETASA